MYVYMTSKQIGRFLLYYYFWSESSTLVPLCPFYLTTSFKIHPITMDTAFILSLDMVLMDRLDLQ